MGYEIDRLAEDIVQVMRTLEIEKPLLVGHSFAGDELTAVAAQYPSLLSGLIYLDAAADRTAPIPEEYTKLFRTLPPATGPASDAYKSYAAMAAYAKQPESEARARYRMSDDGKLVSRVEARVLRAIVAGMKNPQYSRISIPALALFAVPASPEQMFSWVHTEDAALRKNMARLYELNVENMHRQATMFDTEVRDSEAIELFGATHNLIASSEAEVLERIQTFSKTKVSAE